MHALWCNCLFHTLGGGPSAGKSVKTHRRPKSSPDSTHGYSSIMLKVRAVAYSGMKDRRKKSHPTKAPASAGSRDPTHTALDERYFCFRERLELPGDGSLRLRKFLKMSNTAAWQISQLRMGKAMSENVLGTLLKFFDALWCPSGFWGVYQNPRATNSSLFPSSPNSTSVLSYRSLRAYTTISLVMTLRGRPQIPSTVNPGL